MARKNLKSTPTEPYGAKGLPAFNEKPGRIHVRYFYTGSGGSFSKRAFFFSLFAVAALIYFILCVAGACVFNAGLGTFLFGCNAAFGLNYYKNENRKPAMPGAGAPQVNVR